MSHVHAVTAVCTDRPVGYSICDWPRNPAKKRATRIRFEVVVVSVVRVLGKKRQLILVTSSTHTGSAFQLGIVFVRGGGDT